MGSARARILVVDDHLAMAQLLCDQLGGQMIVEIGEPHASIMGAEYSQLAHRKRQDVVRAANITVCPLGSWTPTSRIP